MMFEAIRRLRLKLSGAAIAITAIFIYREHALSILFLGLCYYWLNWTRVMPSTQLRAKFQKWLQCDKDSRRMSRFKMCTVCSGLVATIAVLCYLMRSSTLVPILLVIFAIVSTNQLIATNCNNDDSDYELYAEYMPDMNVSNMYHLECASDNEEDDSDDGENELAPFLWDLKSFKDASTYIDKPMVHSSQSFYVCRTHTNKSRNKM